MVNSHLLRITLSLFSPLLFISHSLAASELDRDFVRPSIERARERLPKTLVMRLSPNGDVAVAHLNEVLPADEHDLKDMEFTKVEPGKAYKQTEFMELDTDLGRENWYYRYRPQNVYYNYHYNYAYPFYPAYFYGGAQFNCYPYFSFYGGGYYYYYYGW
jgi:hypothetical protein